MRLRIPFDEKIKKGPKEKRISLEPWYWDLLVIPSHDFLQKARGY
jgi:hypothetical protein